MAATNQAVDNTMDGIPGTGTAPNGTNSSAYAVPTYDMHTSEPAGQGQNSSRNYSKSSKRFPRISRPVELLRSAYDVVVIGSGYGGGVAASRMSRGRQSVCVLERGKERWPGEYPSNLIEAMPQLHVSGNVSITGQRSVPLDEGDPTGLYHLVVGAGQNAFVGNGLGGTSLLNANVFLEADQKTMDLEYWPKDITAQELKQYYHRARKVLQPEPYPKEYPALPKLEVLEKQAKALGLGDRFYRVPQTTRFVDGPNSTGVEMQSSTLTGMDSTGVNDGSKSSTLVNYLSDAWNWGAEMFCECEVRYMKQHPTKEGYLVFFAWHGSKRGAFKQNIYEDLMWVHAKIFVFLGAGTLGTGEILLRSKQLGLSLSQSIGTGMSGNGDILAFGYNTDENVNGMGKAFPDPGRPIGPTITGVIDCRNQVNPLDGFVIEEGAVPESLVPFLQGMLEFTQGKVYQKDSNLLEKARHMLRRQKSFLLGPYTPHGSVEHTQVYLIMSHDSNQATLTLEKDRPVLRFLGVGRSEHVKYLNDILAQATGSVGGTQINSPFFAFFNEQEITVHPIGGAIMASDGTPETGSTTQIGELLTGQGNEFHEGLVVVDGSVIPTALGVNPFATITALAERSVEKVAEKKGIKIDYTTKNGVLDLFGQPAFPVDEEGDLLKPEMIIREAQATSSPGIEFTEVMSGFIHQGDNIDDFNIAEKMGRGSCEAARFFLSVRSWDIDTLLSRDDHPAMLTGTFTCGALPGSPFMVLRGSFQLFNEDPRTPNTRNLTYDFDMVGTDGSKMHFNGYKVVNSSVAFSPLATWKATSTLYVTLTAPENVTVGRGILHIKPRNFGSELVTFTPVGQSLFSKARTTTQFLTFFTKQVANMFLAPFSFQQWPSENFVGYYANKQPPTRTIKLKASDGVITTMQMWDPLPGTMEAAQPVHILFVPGAAVDHQIFALPTIECNAIEYFQKAGYHMSCVTHRVGKTPVAQKNYTTFDARLDIKAALVEIRKVQKSHDKIYVIAHCAGSLALSMGLLDGTIPGEWIRGITASNVFMNPKFAFINHIKASLPLPLPKIYRLFIGSWFSCISSRDDAFVQQLLDQALRFYPVGSKKEICNSIVCHRSELVFGRLWSHASLNSATHTNLDNFLGGTSMTSLSHLMAMGNLNAVAKDNGESLVTNRNIARLAGIPIFLFSGSENAVFTPESTDISYTMLRDQLGSKDYERVEFQGRGHLDSWMGSTSNKDVYPRVKEHIEKVMLNAVTKKKVTKKKDQGVAAVQQV